MLTLIAENHAFGGHVKRYQHRSDVLDCDMIFAIYLPPQAQTQTVPVMYWLSGLTCTDENFMQKAGAQRVAAELGIAIVCPDTSPRGTDLPGEHDSYDFGSGAGFYLNATTSPWSQHYRMYDYIVDELPSIINQSFPVNGRCSISGHSMGGHGALTIGLKNPDTYLAISAFAPICNPTDCPWGRNVFERYLGNDENAWQAYDACLLIQQTTFTTPKTPLLVDQGEDDEFLAEQLKPEKLELACKSADYPLTLRIHAHYDHSYFFIASFIEEHLRYHAKALFK